MGYVAVSAGEIILMHESESHLRQQVQKICNTFPDLFRSEYITIMSKFDYDQEFPNEGL